ncbi:MAG TPA: hypothetical protein VNT75_00575 [Symbiobacteriaceae bacterium]|nr:hypothetical protein [Symbiobacteriaceae bacterium]
MKRRARWLLLLPLLIGLIGLAGSALAVRPVDRRMAFLAADLPAISRHAIPYGMRLSPTATSFWLVREGETWRAFADRGSGWRTCPLQWEENGSRFADYCGVGLWDAAGLLLGGTAERNLDQYPVVAGMDGYVTVDLSRIQEGAPSPLRLLYQYVADLNLGQREQAWTWIHPARQTDESFGRFKDALTSHMRIAAVERQRRLPTWDDELMQHDMAGGRTWSGVMELDVRWESGDRQTIHVVLDQTGAWKLLWSPAFALE